MYIDTNRNERGAIGTPAVVGGIFVLVALIAIGFYMMSQDASAPQEDSVMMKEDGDAMMIDESRMMGEDEAMMKDEEAMMMESSGSYSGTVLAGTSAPLLTFNQADYDLAVSEGKLVVLYFYANWCPTCKEEYPQAQAAFNQLSTDEVVGFRVNFNDNETDASEKAIAREFGVPYQHTKVLVRNGEQLLKSPEAWDSARFVQEISTRL